MAKKVTFHGRVIRHPGAEVFTDLSGMVQPGVQDTAIAGVVGEAPNGEPGKLHVFADSKSAAEYFGKDSDLANGIQQLFNPTNDDRVSGGASLVYAYKVNASKQSESYLTRKLNVDVTVSPSVVKNRSEVASAPTDDPAGKGRAYIEFAEASAVADKYTGLVMEIFSGAGVGQSFLVDQAVAYDASNNVVQSGGTKYRLFLKPNQDFLVKPATGATNTRIAAPMLRVVANDYGNDGNENEVTFNPSTSKSGHELQTKYKTVVETSAIPVGSKIDPGIRITFDPTGGDLATPANWIVGAESGFGELTTLASSTTTTKFEVDSSALAYTADFFSNKWVIVTGTDNSPSAEQEAMVGRVFKGREHQAKVATCQHDLYNGGFDVPAEDNLKLRILNMTDAYIEVDGENGEAITLTVKIRTHDGAGNFSVTTHATVDLTQYTTYEALIARLNQFPGVAAQLGKGIDPKSLTKGLDFGKGAQHQGAQNLSIVHRSTGADITASATTITLLNTTNFEADDLFPDPAADASAYPFPALVKTFIPATGATKTQEIVTVTGRTGAALTVVRGQGGTTASAHAKADYIQVQRLAQGGSVNVQYNWGAQLVRGPSESSAASGEVVFNDLERFVTYLNTSVGRVSGERVESVANSTFASQIGASIPQLLDNVYKRLSGGVLGTVALNKQDSTDADYPVSYEHGLDELLKIRDIRTEVVLASEDADFDSGTIEGLLTMFTQHLRDCEDNKGERNGYMGIKAPLEAGTYGGTTYAKGILDLIRETNDSRISLSAQEVSVQKVDSSQGFLPAWGLACMSAGVQMGTELGEPLTLKFIRAGDIRSPLNDWDPLDPSDMIKALDGSLLYVEPRSGRFRFVRGYTSYIATDNLAQTDINVWEIRNYLQRRLRDNLEDRFGGRGIGVTRPGVRFVAPANINSIREFIVSLLEDDRQNGIIVDSQDDTGQFVNAYSGLSVRISGDVATVKVQVFPKTGLNFILIDTAFQLPTLSA